ncbi:Clr5 domain-containing protein, partial [Thermothelomyces heterothallicus CBS 202.75]|uniref:Clr5 domain-containing protein n=1 Tax=Thermothelomyces heterothallicus CBS 202.75 TaxID=1149848 RepID=UPI003742741E
MVSWPTARPAFGSHHQLPQPFDNGKVWPRKWLADTATSEPQRRVQDSPFDREPLPGRPMVPVSASDWESKKHIIRELYIDQNMFLNEVIEIMICKYNFKATARMYKGQFAKWKWTKYNKPGKPGPIRPTRSAVGKKKSLPARRAQRVKGWKSTSRERQQPTPLSQPAPLRYFGDEERLVEAALSAYAAMISHWSEQETPWRTAAHDDGGGGGGGGGGDLLRTGALGIEDRSILEQVRCAQDYFLSGRAQQGGDMLRRAFLSIEAALSGDLTIEALWDCCLAVPQLALTTGWTDVLSIFVRYLHQYTSIKLPHHP